MATKTSTPIVMPAISPGVNGGGSPTAIRVIRVIT